MNADIQRKWIQIFSVLHIVGILKEQVFSYAEHQGTPRTIKEDGTEKDASF